MNNRKRMIERAQKRNRIHPYISTSIAFNNGFCEGINKAMQSLGNSMIRLGEAFKAVDWIRVARCLSRFSENK